MSCERAAVKLLGWVALGMLGYGLLCMWGFGKWADATVRRAPNPAPVANIELPQMMGTGSNIKSI